jgi:DNA polymerase I-like protein with 3'-5' exonuclease and polymerase domains
VYDEVTASVPKKHVKDYVEALMDIMQVTLPGTDIVLEAEASVGDSWGRQMSLEKWLKENTND